jgi:hypothetical protein
LLHQKIYSDWLSKIWDNKRPARLLKPDRSSWSSETALSKQCIDYTLILSEIGKMCREEKVHGRLLVVYSPTGDPGASLDIYRGKIG